MRIIEIHAHNIEPIKKLDIQDLSDVVVLAGPNGVGKTRFISWLLRFIMDLPTNSNQWIRVAATSPQERAEWGQDILDTRQLNDANKLRTTLQKQRPRGLHVSSVLNFESDRSISQIQPYSFSWDFQDPFAEMVGWEQGFTRLSGRFQDTVHSIFRKVRSRREAISLHVENLIKAREGLTSETKDEKGDERRISIDPNEFPDPLIPFADAFAQLLAPKSLAAPDPKRQKLFYRDGADERPITDLSSGEREVVNIVFDFLLRNPSDCIIVFDEPELHLHPELSYKLIQTLRNVGARNQFLFITHSADIISASLDHSVVFIAPPRADGSNQAIPVREDDATHQALKLLGQSIGIVSLGRRIVLIEGEHGSLDKQTYGAVLRGKYPNLALVPSGGKSLIQSFSTLRKNVLDKTVWGVEFFMVCDRDAAPGKDATSLEASSEGRFRVLRRYHLENYFLDENVIAQIFESLEESESWLRTPTKISERLRAIARERLSYAAALSTSAYFRERVGNVDLMPKACDKKSATELADLMVSRAREEAGRVNAAIQQAEIEKYVTEMMTTLEGSLGTGDEWKKLVPGREILRIFCSANHAKFDFGRYKTAYIAAAAKMPYNPFEEIDEIFLSFSKSANSMHTAG